jgi:hypothetical protein
MKNNNNVIAVVGVIVAVLIGYALWMMFSSQSTLPASLMTDEDLIKNVNASPEPDQALESQPELSESSEVTSIEADLDNTVILEEDFSDLKE